MIDIRIVLGEANHGLVFTLRLLNSDQRPFTSYKDWRDHTRENDQIAQRQHCRFDQALFVHLHIGDAIQLLCTLREGQVKIIFFFVPFFRMIHLSLLSTPFSADKFLFHASMTSAVTNIEPADNTMLPSFSDNSSARWNADWTGVTASDSIPA